ncbi:hypothetical protein LNY53_29605 [Klebsiella pneumoniae]|nr:hypothetical protein [Klebsiella pneumoniae]
MAACSSPPRNTATTVPGFIDGKISQRVNNQFRSPKYGWRTSFISPVRWLLAALFQFSFAFTA